MKLSLLSAIALASASAAKGDYHVAFDAKASKTRKSHGSKASKRIHQMSPNLDGPNPLDNSSPIDDEGRHPKNSEDGGLVVEDGTAVAGGSEGEDDLLSNDTSADDYATSSTQRFDPVNAMFEWLTQCAEADIDEDTCLVTVTLNSVVDFSHQDDDDTLLSKRRRVIQEEEECQPELSEQDLRNVMNDARAKCSQISDQQFEGIFDEFWTVLSSENCWNELCTSPDIFVKLMFDHAMQCANVDFDVDQCITDQIFMMFVAGADSYEGDDDYYTDDYYYTDDGMTFSSPNHRVLRSLQDVMTDCLQVDEVELAYVASFMLMEAEGRCAELGVSVTLEDISKASTDLVKLFSSPHCFGGAHACPDDEEEEVNIDNADPDGNITSLENGTSFLSETTSTQPTGISPTNDAHDAATSDGENSDEADEEEELHPTASTFDEQVSLNDDGVSFSDGEEIVDDEEATGEENLSSFISEEDDITDANQTSVNGTSFFTDDEDLSLSIEGDVVEAASGDDEADTSTSDGGEGNATATNYVDGEGTSTEDPFSPSIPPENGTTPISNSSTLNATITSSSDNSTGSIFTPQVTDESCDVGPRSGIFERSIEVPYFYIVETIVLEGVVDEIEGMLHLMLCINGVDRRLSVESGETSIVAFESSPTDVVSTEYVCVAQSKEAQNCNVIEGMSTLIVEGPFNSEQEGDLTVNFYLQLEEMFDVFSSVEDSNIVSLEYIGSDPSSLMTRADLQEEVAASDDSTSLFKIIAIGASVVTLFMLIVGAWKMKGKDDNDVTLDGKPIDDKSLAVETAAMTALTGLTSASGSADDTSSDISSTTDAKEFYKNKAFVLAEEEEGNWRNLGILPNQLDDIREEFSHSGSEMADEKSM